MPMTLPTDTVHLRLETRQYELFNRPLGQGISRRKLGIGAVVGGLWLVVMLIAGVNPLSGVGPALYLVPPFAVVHVGTRLDDSGRMRMLLWYDAALARMPRRRVMLRNPLMDTGHHTPRVLPIAVTTDVHPAKPGALSSRSWLRRRAQAGA
jgi:hypothetical protein